MTDHSITVPDSEETLALVGGIDSRDDLAFTHSVFLQCMLPTRNTREPTWKVSHGNASLWIDAGQLIDPDNPHNRIHCGVPAGSKARILFTYINDLAIRQQSPAIDMGPTMRSFMEANGIPVGGSNAKELQRQIQNIAAARIMVGTWDNLDSPTQASQDDIRITQKTSFWLDQDSRSRRVWQPELVLSTDYFAKLSQHSVPVNFRALVALQEAPRAMDAYLWLCYRLRTVKRDVKIPLRSLHDVFGIGIKSRRHFKAAFTDSVAQALRYYPEARVEFESDFLVLKPSPQAIPDDLARGAWGPRRKLKAS